MRLTMHLHDSMPNPSVFKSLSAEHRRAEVFLKHTQTQTRRELLKTSAELTFAHHSVQNGPELMN